MQLSGEGENSFSYGYMTKKAAMPIYGTKT